MAGGLADPHIGCQVRCQTQRNQPAWPHPAKPCKRRQTCHPRCGQLAAFTRFGNSAATLRQTYHVNTTDPCWHMLQCVASLTMLMLLATKPADSENGFYDVRLTTPSAPSVVDPSASVIEAQQFRRHGGGHKDDLQGAAQLAINNRASRRILGIFKGPFWSPPVPPAVSPYPTAMQAQAMPEQFRPTCWPALMYHNA